MDQFEAIDVIMLLGIAQGFFLAITLPAVHRNNTGANAVLAVQLAMACLVLFAKLAIYRAGEFWVLQRGILLEPFIFLYGPLGYIYLKRLLEKGNELFRLKWIQYVLALLYLIYLAYINMLPTPVFSDKWMAGEFVVPFFWIEALAVVHNFYFWFLCGRLVFQYRKRERLQLSFVQSSTSFIKLVHIIVGFILFVWVFSFLNSNFFRLKFWVINYDMVWIGIPILIYVVGYYALRQPEIFRIPITETPESTPVKNRLPDAEIKSLKSKLEELIETEKVYLKNELTLSDLSQELNTSTNNLSWLLNNIYQSSFYEFINRHRIQEFLQKIKNNEHSKRTLLSLSLEVGFNSKSTFNKAFKSILNDTPTSYIKKMGI